jgi:hypothetical protein
MREGNDVAGPSWLAGILAAVMIATALYCVTRLIISRASRRAAEPDVDFVHAVMAVAMAGMLVTRLNPLPNGAWAVLFGAATAWFGGRITRPYRSRRAETGASGRAPGYYVPHLVMSGTMVYMLLAVTVVKSGSASHVIAAGGAGGGAHFPVIAIVLALFMFGYVMWQADRLPALARAGGRSPAFPGMTGTASGAPLARAASQPAPHAQAATGTQSLPAAAAATGHSPGAASPRGRPLSPRLAACYQIAMGITMGYMLIMMV